ncbi:MAG: hypothetical protein JW807_12895 [Spirochaetes bacterium]|nr:hypothetical protein [Spirochaetota bacterium]
MIELQGFWDNVLASRAGIEKARETERSLEKDLADGNRRLASLGNTVKELKNSTKQNELDLKEKEERISKLEERKKIIHTEKELKALEKEIDVIRFDIGALEEKGLAVYDELDARQTEYAELEEAVGVMGARLNETKTKHAGEIADFENTIKTNESAFNSLVGSLAVQHKSRFLKLIQSKDGKGIARVDGEICGFCNRKIPASLAIDSGKDEKVVTCSNCGKFIYR